MSIGMLLLLMLSILILFGVVDRVLDRMALTDRQALFLTAALFIGGLLPDLSFGLISVNIGGALVPLGVCIYLLIHAGTGKERLRALAASAVSAAVICAIGFYFPAYPEETAMDPMLLYGLAGGFTAWLLGRSRRSAFIAGVLGMLLADLISGVTVWAQGIQQTIHLGGAGAMDAVVISGITAVLLCELVGEIMERMTRGPKPMEGGQHA